MSHPLWYTIRMIETMKEMKEMNKVFEDFSKKCDETIKACQDFIDMDIKTSEPTLEPSVKRTKMATQRDEEATLQVVQSKPNGKL